MTGVKTGDTARDALHAPAWRGQGAGLRLVKLLMLAAAMACARPTRSSATRAGVCEAPPARTSEVKPPSLCEAATRAGIQCSGDGVPVLDGPRPPRLELVTECEAAARVGAPCTDPDGFVLLIDY